MATTSTIPTVKAQMVTELTTALATSNRTGGQLPVDYAWPGPNTQSEHVFLGPHPETADIRLDASQQIPTIKAGRKHRQEDYTVRITVWTFKPELTAKDAADAESRAFAISAKVEDVIANDVTLGLAQGVVQNMSIESVASTVFPFKSGWACELAIDVAVRTRLT